MRIHSLEITGFGPFAGTECVDVDALAADGLFLLHGHTGAGKTTVLDAVAFALYGTVPGARRDGRRLRSDHAAPGTRTEVVLEATIAGRALRIRRSPEYMRPKKRGSGETKENARATLEWLDGSGENLSRIDEIGAVVRRLLGMSAEQFFQVVLLPQGEFAQFLKAETSKRAALLEKLFDTSRFTDIEGWFAERRKRGREAVADAEKAVEVAVGGVEAAAEHLAADAGGGDGADGAGAAVADGGGPGGGAPESADGDIAELEPAAADGREDDPVGWARLLCSRAGEEAERAGSAAAEARTAAGEARARAERDRARATAQRRRAEALETLDRFERGAEGRKRAAAELEAAKRAEQAGWADTARADAESERDGAVRRLSAELRTLAENDTAAADILGPLPEDREDSARAAAVPATSGLERLLRDRDVELARLEDAEEDESALAQLTAERAEVEASAEVLASRVAEVGERTARFPGQIDEASAALRTAAEAAESLPALQRECDAAASVEEATRRVPALEFALLSAQRELSAAEKRRDATRSHALDVRERRLDGIAAELAGVLRDGEPCSVCGSREHPAPTEGSAATVTKEDEDAAAAALQDASAVCDEARRAEYEGRTALSVAQERAAGTAPEDAAQRTATARQGLERAQEAAGGGPQAEAALADLERQYDAARAEAERLAAESKEAGERLAGLGARIGDLRARLRDAVGIEEGVREKARQLRRSRERVAAVLELTTSARSAQRDLDRAVAAVRDAALKAGFGDAEDALGAVRTHSRREQIRVDLEAGERAAAGARAVLDEPDVAAEEGAGPVDPGSSAAVAEECSRRLEEAVVVHGNAARRSAAVAKHSGEVEEAVARLAPVLEQQRWLAALAEVIAGDGENARRMSLRSYVLAARLEEVAVVASQRLRRMSGGRYEFVHTEAAVRRERRGGLGLDILDANTGTVRPTSTLSGGETFMASLSLALGLADVVSAEAGGITLETLFIDEGFGTLDADALDLVMRVLDELRSGGRAVGIVSHVAEMRQRIPSRLQVVKGEDGSSLRMAGAAVAQD